jgi:hypothetical protein
MKSILLLSLLVCAVASADDLQKTYDGKIVVAREEFPKTMDDRLAAFLHANAKPDDHYELTGDGTAAWTCHLMAFLSQDPGSAATSLVFYDANDAEALKKHRPIQSMGLETTKGGRILRVAEVSLWPDDGFTVGKTYLVRATQDKGGAEVVLAEAQITLAVSK